MKRLLFGACALALLFSSCEKVNRPEKVPAFLSIEPFTLTTSTSEGTDSHQITDAWLYVNSQLIGTYELPANIPVIIDSAGDHDITIRPGIKNNGISAERKTYPFYIEYRVTKRLSADSTTVIQPSTEYLDNLNIWLEEFESAGINFSSPSESDTSIHKTTDPQDVFEGAGAGKMVLASDQEIVIGETSQNFEIPSSTERIYIELNYKSNTHFRAGLISNIDATDVYRPVLVMTPTTDESGVALWNKIYIELTEQIKIDINSAAHFDIFFEAQKDDGLTTTETVIDNVKLIYFD